jgi:hypothetical protein
VINGVYWRKVNTKEACNELENSCYEELYGDTVEMVSRITFGGIHRIDMDHRHDNHGLIYAGNHIGEIK